MSLSNGTSSEGNQDNLNNASRKLKIFLSHSPADHKLIQTLRRRLKTDGIEPWLEQENILPGQNEKREIRQAINNSDVVIICFSSKSVDAIGSLQREIKLAFEISQEYPEGAIFIIPVKLDECEIPVRLNELSEVKYYEETGYETLLKALRARAASLGKTCASGKVSSIFAKLATSLHRERGFSLLTDFHLSTELTKHDDFDYFSVKVNKGITLLTVASAITIAFVLADKLGTDEVNQLQLKFVRINSALQSKPSELGIPFLQTKMPSSQIPVSGILCFFFTHEISEGIRQQIIGHKGMALLDGSTSICWAFEITTGRLFKFAGNVGSLSKETRFLEGLFLTISGNSDIIG